MVPEEQLIVLLTGALTKILLQIEKDLRNQFQELNFTHIV